MKFKSLKEKVLKWLDNILDFIAKEDRPLRKKSKKPEFKFTFREDENE